ncbi:gamma-glutamylcyclotransferase family protein [Solidesulfovibrio magneticus]|uniref:Gamma-glutamylcyclotransferase family protein n=1 Tax=Solidesulfovibrio magneticus (strain ATCC 700980 / DSM 13731 / RS-1) TaxID=573370 RepID=C4XL93_SOLM1|nr:gamma-glutamylcyclotransferase family protein [Solidesulfovibrio magneticus]BAH77034.1 hypothetical protein DMR_35430 [Solidesulfovibrio magneticus RS-1]
MVLLYNFFARKRAAATAEGQPGQAGPEAAAIGDGSSHVFVYGTLRRGFSNHRYLAGARFVGPGRTVDAHGLYLEAGIPYLAAGEGRYPVVGEVYAADAATLAGLDELEEHPRVYTRRPAPIVLGDGRRLTAWVYFANEPQGAPLASGDFADAGCASSKSAPANSEDNAPD